MEEKILTIREVATLLKYSEATIRSWVKSGKLPAFKIGRKYRIRLRDINKHFKQHLQEDNEDE
ncbi:hypothetical protein A3A76_04415 [Candidatus Woesebacteria bacterium RIFCSPLOWO2_01_FULL_39_23]|uniref:Helix-turn-helix domain-containing protein n=1 Tax=Candidatus Woesebacteria bacterium RIFCSPHIGHO2_01_FULL_40_22 TaxID=1802499 RepID=A0A1F7YHL1_9BACT|nr:MAG: hypothetical protein A2Z35_04235 [Actinobacteria bacterium RBG_19FT_COMBO_36_27]OGM12728.1 MAG: hypothetical protein A2141_01980 [Candidatus Woesebacteria bacterium RBG_16_40_11]OGM25995.1 MAG: hypothetical protein A2628_00415 [Candidatus Woesebacteria bacterium RIFCSPHIGHO2_01_FULL_40_22]OGM38106.1 MAG: hypothetical protein A3E41_03500 [Candidatus Woesebacteria bacterium RIFCSPHIGHO2_12_FULL_38_9]OGM61844.1 MAG: hypothetical protein A3A76_04415 [Candidatus Woesebacteria bacterium RIFCS